MSEPQILCRMCDNRVNKAVHGLAAILLVRLVGQPPKNVKNEICPYRCFAFYTRTARLTWLEMTHCHTQVTRYFLHVSLSIVGCVYVARICTLTIIAKVFV